MQIVLTGLEPGQVVTVRGKDDGAEVEVEGRPPAHLTLDGGHARLGRIVNVFVRVAAEAGDDLLEQLKRHGASRVTMDEITHGGLARVLERVEQIALVVVGRADAPRVQVASSSAAILRVGDILPAANEPEDGGGLGAKGHEDPERVEAEQPHVPAL